MQSLPAGSEPAAPDQGVLSSSFPAPPSSARDTTPQPPNNAAPRRKKILKTEIDATGAHPKKSDKKVTELPALDHKVTRAKRQPGSVNATPATTADSLSPDVDGMTLPSIGNQRSRSAPSVRVRVRSQKAEYPSTQANSWASRQQRRAEELKTGRITSARRSAGPEFVTAARKAQTAFRQLMEAVRAKSFVDVVRGYRCRLQFGECSFHPISIQARRCLMKSHQ